MSYLAFGILQKYYKKYRNIKFILQSKKYVDLIKKLL